MKENRLIRIEILLILCYILSACGKVEENPSVENIKGSVYGTVTYLATGDPVDNAIVQLKPRHNATINIDVRQTGHDGYYEFCDVEDETYDITVSKTGYDDWIGRVVIKEGVQIRKDIQIEKKPEIYTYEVTNLTLLGHFGWGGTNWSVILNGFISSAGSPPYQERGFCYGTGYHMEDYKVVVSGNGIGTFSKEITGSTSSGYDRYYFKAYVKTAAGEYIYGETLSFDTPN